MNRKNINLLLKDLHFDKRVADMVEDQKVEFPVELVNNIFVTDTFKLNIKRLVSVLDGYESGLPPVQVKKKSGKYIVVNGRHRVCATILKGGKTVACIERHVE